MNQQSDQLRRNDGERTVSIRFLNFFVRELCSVRTWRGAGIELTTATYGKVYNGITDDGSCGQPESDPTVCLRYWGLQAGRVAARVLPGASLCTLPCLFGWSRDQDGRF